MLILEPIPGTGFQVPTTFGDRNADFLAFFHAAVDPEDKVFYSTFRLDVGKSHARFELMRMRSKTATSPADFRAQFKKTLERKKYTLADESGLLLAAYNKIRFDHPTTKEHIIIASLVKDIVDRKSPKPHPHILCLNGRLGKMPFQDFANPVRGLSLGILVKLKD